MIRDGKLQSSFHEATHGALGDLFRSSRNGRTVVLKKSPMFARVGQAAIAKIGRAVRAEIAAGRSIADLSTGEPDFNTPDNIKEAAFRAIRDNDTHYTANDGTPALKAAIQTKFERDNGLSFSKSEIAVASGGKMLLFAAFIATLSPGDEVIVPAPYWGNYVDMVRITGATPIVLETSQENGFLLKPDELEKAITPQTRWVMLNSPSNPSGAVYSEEQYEALLNVIERHPHVWLICDDIYEHIVFDGRRFITPLQVRPNLRDRTFILNGVSKGYAMTGWRIGYGAGPTELIEAMLPVFSQSTSAPCSIAQAAAAEALRGPMDSVEAYRQEYQARRDLVVNDIAGIPQLSLAVPHGAFYVFPRWEALKGARTPAGDRVLDDEQFCQHLLTNHGLAAVPGTAFGVSGHIRLSFASSRPVLEDAMARLRAACSSLTM